MQKLKPVLTALVLLILGVAGIKFFGLVQKPGSGANGSKETAATETAPKSTFSPTKQQWANLAKQKVVAQPFRTEIVTDGKIAIDEDRTTPVFSPNSGVIKRLAVNPGDPIEGGQLLFTIEATDMVQAQNDFIVAIDGIKTADSNHNMAQITEKRQKALFEAKATAMKDWQQSQADLVTAENAKRTAEIGLEAVRNRLRLLKKTDAEIADFERSGKINPETPIYAPIAGTVVQRKVGPGQYITAGASDPTGDPVFVIGNLSTVWLVANVREADTLDIRRGQEVSFKVLSARDRIFTAKISYVAEILDANTRRLLVRATIDNADRILKPEMFSRVTIYTSEAQTSPAIPREAVIYEGQTARVWVLAKDNALELRPVTLGAFSGAQVQVLEGLSADDEVITKGTLFIDRAASGGDQPGFSAGTFSAALPDDPGRCP